MLEGIFHSYLTGALSLCFPILPLLLQDPAFPFQHSTLFDMSYDVLMVWATLSTGFSVGFHFSEDWVSIVLGFYCIRGVDLLWFRVFGREEVGLLSW